MRKSPHRAIFNPEPQRGRPFAGATIGADPPNAGTGAAAQAAQTASGSGTAVNPVNIAIATDPFCVCRYLDDYLVIGFLGGSISVVNIADPLAPFVEGSSAADSDLGIIRGICVIGDHAFTVSGSSTTLPQIGSWDLSDVTAPVLDDKLTKSRTYRAVCALANDANYIACSRLLGDDLDIIDISDPTNITNPESITNDDYLQGILDMQPIGNYIILNSATDLGTPCIVTLNVTNPLAIAIETNKLFQAHAGQFANGDLLIDGSYGYVVGDALNGGLHFTVLNLADPTNVTEEGYVFSDVLSPGDTTPMILAKEPGVDTVYVLDVSRVHKFDVTTKTSPTLTASYGPNTTFGFSETASPHQEAVWAKDRIFRVGSNNRLYSLAEM